MVNSFNHNEIPEDREAEELRRGKKDRWPVKPPSRTVSMGTYTWTLRIITLIILIAFLAAAGFGIHWAWDLFSHN